MDGHTRLCYRSRWRAGYTFQFLTQVKDGYLVGEHEREGQPSWLKLQGRIEPTGEARLSARGLTGQEKYSVDRLRKGTPYSYHVKAYFDTARGTGTRVETRKCDLVFLKQ